MKKRSLPLMFVFILILSTLVGCGKKEEPKEDASRMVEIQQCGLRYEAPTEWIPYENSNLYPETAATTEGDIYSYLRFNYISDENMEKLNQVSEDLEIKDLMTPITEILVIHKDKLKSSAVLEAFGKYKKHEEVGTAQGDYRYFILTDYQGDFSRFTEKQNEVYNNLKKGVFSLEESIETFPFDTKPVEESIEKIKSTITFQSKTLEGKEISSAIFGNYDLTIVNFWASYCYPDINESEAMETLNKKIKQAYPNVNLIQVVIDTPTPEKEEIALQAKKEVGGTYTSVMPDEILANWILSNLGGLPTTIFVNKEAVMVGEAIEGINTADFYLDTLDKQLETLKNAKTTESKKTEN